MHYEVDDVIKYTHNYLCHVCKRLFCVTKPHVHQHLLPFGKKKKDEKNTMVQWINFDQSNSFINRTRLPLLCEKSGAIFLCMGPVWQAPAVRRNTTG